MDSLSRPMISLSWATVPCSTNSSGIPILVICGRYPWSLIHSSMADPNPPFLTPSSMVMMRSNFFAISSSSASSSGLRNRIS